MVNIKINSISKLGNSYWIRIPKALIDCGVIDIEHPEDYIVRIEENKSEKPKVFATASKKQFIDNSFFQQCVTMEG